jgi:hypothetical protein|tara:strand:- start:299 stop:478 length:180 start_codon:yes stop_codon:yes gene_type:complete
MKPTIAQGSTSYNSEASFAMLKDLLEIGLAVEQLQGTDKFDLEFELVQIRAGDGFVGTV